MLDQLHSSFTVLASEASGGLEDIQRLLEKFGPAPKDYLSLLNQGSEIELGHADGAYLRIWAPSGCFEMDEGYAITQWIPGSFPIGDNGGGRIILYMSGAKGFGLYLVGYGELDVDEAIWAAPRLQDLLVNALG